MQLANNHPLLISEHKRTSYDKDGAVEKIDILRSIRRKDTQPSFLPSFLQKNSTEDSSSSSLRQSKFKQILQYFLIATIIFCTLLLIMNICGISLQFSTNSTTVHQQPTSENQSSQLMKFINNNNNNSLLFSNINCSVDQMKFNSIEQVINCFQTQLQIQLLKLNNNSSEQSDNQLLNLNEFTKSITLNDHSLMNIILYNFAQTLNCKIQSNKIVCQHQLKP